MTQRRIYQNDYPYFITFRIGVGGLLFRELKYAELMSKIIFNTCEIKYFSILSYQIMPDHVHLLVDSIKMNVIVDGCGDEGEFNIHQAQPAVVACQSKIESVGRRRKYFNVSELMHGIKSYYCDQIRDQYKIDYPIFQKRFYALIIYNR